MTTETWKDLPGFEGQYQVSDQGRVKALPQSKRFVSKLGRESWRVTRGRVLSPATTREGYQIAHFQVDCKRHAQTVHSLVLLAFVGPRPLGFDINHINGVKTDNRLENLEYVTRKENAAHALDRGLVKQAVAVQGIPAWGEPLRFASIARAAKHVGVTDCAIGYALKKGTVCRGYKWVRA